MRLSRGSGQGHRGRSGRAPPPSVGKPSRSSDAALRRQLGSTFTQQSRIDRLSQEGFQPRPGVLADCLERPAALPDHDALLGVPLDQQRDSNVHRPCVLAELLDLRGQGIGELVLQQLRTRPRGRTRWRRSGAAGCRCRPGRIRTAPSGRSGRSAASSSAIPVAGRRTTPEAPVGIRPGRRPTQVGLGVDGQDRDRRAVPRSPVRGQNGGRRARRARGAGGGSRAPAGGPAWAGAPHPGVERIAADRGGRAGHGR